ncbi:MAG TPA: hypothetical protein DHV55_18640 [Clostridiaceae bacterium]|nr:hypothetical protein [Clostridiaceae bacterium]
MEDKNYSTDCEYRYDAKAKRLLYATEAKNKIGRRNYIDFLEGQAITRLQAIKAKCFECNNYYVDGAEDCKVCFYPLYGFMPYRNKKEEEKKDRKVITVEHIRKLIEGRAKNR